MNNSIFESIFAVFDDKPPFFCLFWTLFGQFLGTFPIWPVLIIPWLLNWIIFWIESAEYFLNWIIFWIESWVKQYWINRFLAKFKYWIESDWVSATTKWWWWWCCHFDFSSSVTFLQSSYFTPLHRSCQTKLALSRRCHTKARTDSQNLIWKRTQTQIQPTKLHRQTHNYTLIGLYSCAIVPMTWFYLS